MQPETKKLPKSLMRSNLVAGFGFFVFILLILSGLHLWRADIYQKQFDNLIAQKRFFSLYSRISLELEQQSKFLLSFVYQNNPKSRKNFDQSRQRALNLMRNVEIAEKCSGEIQETSRLQTLKLQQISYHLNETAGHVFKLMDRGNISEAKKRVDDFVRPLLENELPVQSMFFINGGMEHLEQTRERWNRKEKQLTTISNIIIVICLFSILFISIILAKKILRAESEISEASERKYRSVFENSLDGIYRSTPEGRFIDVNPALVDILGYESREELLSISIAKDLYFSESDRPASNKRNKIFRTRYKRKNGEKIWVEVNSRAFFDKENGAVYHEGIVRDTTQRDDLEKRLRQAQKMEAIGKLAGGIAHDFNNILTPILGYTEIVLADLSPGSRMSKNLEHVMKAGERARDLAVQILTFSRQTEGMLKPVQLVPIVKEALKLLEATLPSTIEIHHKIPKETGIVNADSTQIHQVLMNLCINAGHAMPEGGTLEVSLNNVELEEKFCAKHEGLRAGFYVRLTVMDTGCGMDERTMSHVFEPFFTTKGPGKGTGMGLSVVYGIVKSHNGYISVYSEPGAGTAFHVYMPVIESIAGTLPETLKPAQQQGSESILLVDDEPMIVDMGRKTLKQLGYRVTARTSSIKALELFGMKPMEFDLVITDNTMPQMTGLALINKILDIRPDIPIILCSGINIDRNHIDTQGIGEIVMKPFTGADLGRAVRRVLDEDGF